MGIVIEGNGWKWMDWNKPMGVGTTKLGANHWCSQTSSKIVGQWVNYYMREIILIVMANFKGIPMQNWSSFAVVI